jgi:Flp pilus assembly protein TadD
MNASPRRPHSMPAPFALLVRLCLAAASCLVLGTAPGAHAQSALTQGQAVDAPSRSAGTDPAVRAPSAASDPAPPPVVDPRALSEKERRAYADTLREVRSDIDRKQYQPALDALDRLIAAHPREPQARFMKGLALAEAGRRDEAVATLRALLADFPELPEPRNNLAVLYAQHGEFDLARDELELALRAAPDYAVAHENLADVYARMAADHYQRAGERGRRNKTAPAKLKLVRDVTHAP